MKNPSRLFSFAFLARLAGLAAILPFAGAQIASAAPLVSIGDTVDIFFRGDVSARYDSNIFNNAHNKRDDFIFVFSPGVEISAGRSENANITLIFREDFVRYARTSRVNADLANLFIDGFYKTGPATISSGFSFYQTQQNTGDINLPNVLISRNIYRAYAELEYDITQKTFADIGFSWNRTEFTSFENVYYDRDVYAVPLNVFYRFSPKLNIGLGYRYRYTSVDDTTGPAPGPQDGVSYLDHFFSVALRGEILPKVTARMNIGAQVRETKAADVSDDTTFTANTSLIWAATPKTTVALNLDRDFATGGTGQTVTRTGGDIRGTYAFSNFIQSSAVFGYTWNDYTNSPREDKTTLIGADIAYTPNSYLRFSAGYTYQNNESNQDFGQAAYQSHLVNLTASLRY